MRSGGNAGGHSQTTEEGLRIDVRRDAGARADARAETTNVWVQAHAHTHAGAGAISKLAAMDGGEDAAARPRAHVQGG